MRRNHSTGQHGEGAKPLPSPTGRQHAEDVTARGSDAATEDDTHRSIAAVAPLFRQLKFDFSRLGHPLGGIKNLKGDQIALPVVIQNDGERNLDPARRWVHGGRCRLIARHHPAVGVKILFRVLHEEMLSVEVNR